MDEPERHVTVATSAPGKLFVFGEYGVLSGGWSIVASVDRRVIARRYDSPSRYQTLGADLDDATTLPEAVLRGLSSMRARDIAPGHLSTDIRHFFDTDGGEKLGLGSSAASTVALSAACLLDADQHPVDERTRQEIFEHAFEAHRRLQGGRGSGADVASSTYGGIIAYRLTQPVAPFPRCPGRQRGGTAETRQAEVIAGLDVPEDVRIEPIWLGRPARSTSFVRCCERALREDAEETQRALCRTAKIADQALDALRNHSGVAQFVRLVERADAALEALGDCISAPIVTDAHRELRGLAAANGIAAKPSGAGGGDFSLAIGPRDAEWAPFLQNLPVSTRHLALDMGADGVRPVEHR